MRVRDARLKVGIGPGSDLHTRMVAGVGVPQLDRDHGLRQSGRGDAMPIIADLAASSFRKLLLPRQFAAGRFLADGRSLLIRRPPIDPPAKVILYSGPQSVSKSYRRDGQPWRRRARSGRPVFQKDAARTSFRARRDRGAGCLT